MRTSIPNISKPYLLDDFIASTNLFVKLFVNNVKGNEETIIFLEPDFVGYSPQNIQNSNWLVSILSKDYATCTYSTPIIFNNLDPIYASDPIVGYYVTNDVGDNLWYDTFETSRILSVEEGMAINLTVNLNKPDSGRTFVTLVLNTSSPDVYSANSILQISNEFWGDVPVGGSLTDIMNRDLESFNSVFNLVLSPEIFPSVETPYTFTAFFQKYGFKDLSTEVIVSKKGINIINLNLDPVDNPPPMPTLLPEPDYNDDDIITLNGPYDEKAGTTLSSISEDIFSFLYKKNIQSNPENMSIFINDLCVASVDYFSGYKGSSFNYTYESIVFTGVFSPEVKFTVDGLDTTVQTG